MPSPTQLRSDVALLVREADRDIDALLRGMDDPKRAEEALRDLLPSLVDTYGAAAGTVAADWYDDLREERGVPRSFTAIPAEIPDPGAHALIGWALTEATDFPAFKNLILGGTQRRIANFSRLTVTGSSIADPSADGWQRVSRGGCSTGFCDMLAGRGAVYSEATADFASHDHCQCYATPAFSGESRPVKPYTPSTRQATDADRARVRAWIADNL